MRNSGTLILSALLSGVIFLGACSSAPAHHDAEGSEGVPSWARSLGRQVQGGDIVHVGSGVDEQRDRALFKAEAAAIEALVGECSLAHKNIVIWNRFAHRRDAQFEAFAEAALPFADCERARNAKGAERDTLTSAKLEEDQDAYRAMTGRPVLTPAWTRQNTQVRRGDLLEIYCSGSAESLELARHAATESCSQAASSQLAPLAIGPDNPALRCRPLKEALERSEQQVKVHLLCQFDLAQLKPEKAVAAAAEASPQTAAAMASAPVIVAARRTLMVSSMPPCDSIVISSAKGPRTVACKTQPMALELEAGDELLTVRANDFSPQTIDLRKLTKSQISVMLEPAGF